MNNDPVAWMSPDGKVSDTEGKLFYIPLYTHQAKELTERIRKLETALQGWEIGFEKMGYERLLKDKDEYIAELLKEPIKELTDEEITDFINAFCLDMGDYWELTEKNAIPMIRAILKKAQEKC